MKNNFDLRKFLTENKLTPKSKLKEDFAPSPNSDIPDANAEDFDVATAFKKARVDMSKPVSVVYSYGHAQYSSFDKDEMSAEAAIKRIEAERQENRNNYLDDGEEVPSDIHGYEFENYSVLEEDMPEGHEYKLSYYLGGDYTYSITQEKSGVSEEVNEQLASQAIQEFIAADNNGVSLAEFDLRKFLTENKLTSNSKLLKEDDVIKSHPDEIEDANFPVADAFEKVSIDMSKDVHVHYQDGGPPGLGAGRLKDKGLQSAGSVVKMLEAKRLEKIEEYKEVDNEYLEYPVYYEYFYYGGEKFIPEGKEFKLTWSVFEGETYDIFQ